MPSLPICSHIKTNGQKCGSPALRHHTLCYFHYQWQRRDQRRIRLGGPIGMGKNSGIDLPLLDGPEAILISIMEIQRGLLDQRIPIKMGTALLYSLQLALQAKISAFGLGHSSSVRECPELDYELELERAKGMRPAKEKCAACPKRDDCLSPRGCKKLPKVPGYHRVNDRLVRDSVTPEVGAPFFAPASGAKGGAVPDTTPPCHPERSAAVSRGAEGPCVSPPEATPLAIPSEPDTGTNLLLESSPAGDCGETSRKFPPSRANARRQIDAPELAPNSYADCILGSKPNAFIDLAGKFPQLAETKQPENRGVGASEF